jgi:YVTN family beta-propeller protein
MVTRRTQPRPRLNRERGISLIAVVIAMLLLSLLGTVLVSIVTTERYAGMNQVQGMSAQYLAEAGLDRALHYFFNPEQQSCGINNNLFNAKLGGGNYTVATMQYAPTTLLLTAALTETDTSFTVNGNAATVGYAPYGIVVIDQEDIECAQVTSGATSVFSSCKRGINPTSAGSHALTAKVYQDFCIVNATGTIASALSSPAQRVVSIGFSQFDQGWAVGDAGTILQWNGIAWSAATSPTSRHLRTVKLTALNRGWTAGDLGVMGQLNGTTWSKDRSAYIDVIASNGNNMTFLDTDPYEIGLPTRSSMTVPISGGGATEVAATPNGRYLYVTRNGSNDVVVINTDTKSTVGAPMALGANAKPRGITVSPDGTKVYVVNEGVPGSPKNLAVITRVNDADPTQDTCCALISLDPTATYTPHYIALAPDGTRAFVTTTGSPGNLEMITGLPGAPSAPTLISLGDTDQGTIAMNPDGFSAYVVGKSTGQLFRIDTFNNPPAQGGVILNSTLGGTPMGIGYTGDGLEAYVSVKNIVNNVNKVVALDTATNLKVNPGGDISVDSGPVGLANSADGGELYVANVTAGRVNVIKVANHTTGAAETISGGVTGGIVAGPAANVRSVSMLGPNEGWAVGHDGRILHWTVTPPATTPAWVVQPLVTIPTPTLPPNTQPNSDGTWTTTIQPDSSTGYDSYVRMNDDVKDDGTSCGSPPLGCTNSEMYGVMDSQRLGLRRVYEDPNPANVNVVGDRTDPNNSNQKLYRPYLKFDLSTVKQYAKVVTGAGLQLRAYLVDPAPQGTTTTAGPGIVLNYEFEPGVPVLSGCEAPPGTVYDSSGSSPANTGRRCVGTSYTTDTDTNGDTRTVLSFDGATGRVVVRPSTSLALTTNLTVETWVNFTNPNDLVTTVPPNVKELIRKGLDDSHLSYMLSVKDGKPAFTVKINGVPIPSVSSGSPLQAGQWYHLAGTYDGLTVNIYQDGVVKMVTPVTGGGNISTGSCGASPCPPSSCGSLAPVANSLCIGGSGSSGSAVSFNGLMDETRIYNGALTESQIGKESGWGARRVNVNRVTTPWGVSGASGVTGASQPVIGETAAYTTVTEDNVPKTVQSGVGKWVAWPITRLVQQWVDDTYPNYGVVLRVGLDPDLGQTDPSPNGILWLYSADALTSSFPVGSNYRPRLVVTYRVGGPNLQSIAMVDTNGDGVADGGWAVGEAGIIFHYDGATWSQWTSFNNGGTVLPTQGLNGVSMSNITDGWAVGDGGTIFHYTATPPQWQQVQAGLTPNDLTAVSIAPNGWGIAVGKNGTILSYSGTNWISDPSAATNPNLLAIKAFSYAKGWGAGEDGTIVRKRGGQWAAPGDPGTEQMTTNHLRGIDMLPSQTTVTDWRENYQ